MGLGLLGRGVGEAAFLAECGAKLIITDLKTRGAVKKFFDKTSKIQPRRTASRSRGRKYKICFGRTQIGRF